MSLVNLLPDDYLQRRAQKRANLLCGALFVVVMAGVLGAASVSEMRYRNTRAVSERVNVAYAEAQKLIEQLRTLEATKQQMLVKADMTTQLLERVPRSYLMATVANALPAGASLKEVDLKCERSRTTVISAKPNTRFQAAAAKSKSKAVDEESRLEISMTITGMAATDVEVARFIAGLARCPLVDAVDLVYSQEKEYNKCIVREFQVVLALKSDADVRGDTTGVAVAQADEPDRGEQKEGPR